MIIIWEACSLTLLFLSVWKTFVRRRAGRVSSNFYQMPSCVSTCRDYTERRAACGRPHSIAPQLVFRTWPPFLSQAFLELFKRISLASDWSHPKARGLGWACVHVCTCVTHQMGMLGFVSAALPSVPCVCRPISVSQPGWVTLLTW